MCFAQTAALQLRGYSCSAAYAAVGARRQLRLSGCSCGVGDGNDGILCDNGDDSDDGDNGVAVLRAVMSPIGSRVSREVRVAESSGVSENNKGASALDSGLPMKAV